MNFFSPALYSLIAVVLFFMQPAKTFAVAGNNVTDELVGVSDAKPAQHASPLQRMDAHTFCPT